MRVTRRLILQSVLPVLLAARPARAEAGPIRVGVLKFGTVSWELDTMRAAGLDTDRGVALQAVEFASSQATQVALQAGDVDLVALDWLWVSRQRAAGADWRFAPLSSAVGALIVPAASAIRTVGDLAGKRLGIAGSPLDKSWLILLAYAKARLGLDLDRLADKTFGAPPLLQQALDAGRLDATLTFWPFAARAEAAGARVVLGVGDMLAALGIPPSVPIVGYVFSDRWATRHRSEILAFLAAAAAARSRLAGSDAEWERLRPATGARSDAELARLRDWYRSGIPAADGAAGETAAHGLYRLLREAGGDELTGPAPDVAPGTFWSV
jgi:NitT/TauT family transport system substrate-binding protein